MTALQFAFVLLCLAQLVHFSRHLVILTTDLIERARADRMRKAVNWNAPRRR